MVKAKRPHDEATAEFLLNAQLKLEEELLTKIKEGHYTREEAEALNDRVIRSKSQNSKIVEVLSFLSKLCVEASKMKNKEVIKALLPALNYYFYYYSLSTQGEPLTQIHAFINVNDADGKPASDCVLRNCLNIIRPETVISYPRALHFSVYGLTDSEFVNFSYEIGKIHQETCVTTDNDKAENISNNCDYILDEIGINDKDLHHCLKLLDGFEFKEAAQRIYEKIIQKRAKLSSTPFLFKSEANQNMSQCDAKDYKDKTNVQPKTFVP